MASNIRNFKMVHIRCYSSIGANLHGLFICYKYCDIILKCCFFFYFDAIFLAILTTVEKRFGLESKEVAFVYSGNEISSAILVAFLPFFSSIKKRPLFLGLVAVLTNVPGLLLMTLPHFTGSSNHGKPL